MLAYHYERSDNKKKALTYMDLANQKAFIASAMEDAKGYFYKAMEILDTMPDTMAYREQRIFLLVNQRFVFEQLFQMPDYYDLLKCYEHFTAEIKNIGLKGGFYCRMGSCENILGYFDKAMQTQSKAVELCEMAGNAEYSGMAFLGLQWCYLQKGNFDRVVSLKKDIHRMTAIKFNLLTHVRSFIGSSQAFTCCGRWDEALEEGNRALNIAKEYADDSQISFAALNISLAYIYKGEISRGIKYGEMALEKAPAPGYKAWAKCTLSWAWCRAGEPFKGIEILENYIQIFQAGRFVFAEVGFSTCLAEGYLIAEAYDKAEQAAMKALEVADRCGAKFWAGRAHRLLGEVALKTNDLKDLSHFDKSIINFKAIKAENELALAYTGVGRFYKKKGDTAKAREYLSKALEIFERLGTLIEPDKVKQELASLDEK